MELPYIVQYLLALRRPDSIDPVCRAEISADIITFLPGQLMTVTYRPSAGQAYARFGFFAGFGPEVVPGAIDISFVHYGSIEMTGTLTSWFLGQNIYSFFSILDAQPMRYRLTNQSNLIQRLTAFTASVRIESEEDYLYCIEALRRMDSMEANNLLKLLAQASGAEIVRPPVS